MRLQHRCFPANLAKFLRTPILKNWGNGMQWKKTSEANLACLLSINLSGSSLKAFLEQHAEKKLSNNHDDKNR